MRSSEMYTPVSARDTAYFGNTKFSFVEQQPNKVAGSTARHETAHVFALKLQDIGIKKATVVPNHRLGYLGMVEAEQPNAVAAAAAHAMGHDGTGHDLMVADMLGGRESATAEASTLLSGEHEDMERFAVHLEEEGTMDGSRVDQVFQDVKAGKDITVFIQHEDGHQQIEQLKAKDGIVMIPNTWFPLAKVA